MLDYKKGLEGCLIKAGNTTGPTPPAPFCFKFLGRPLKIKTKDSNQQMQYTTTLNFFSICEESHFIYTLRIGYMKNLIQTVHYNSINVKYSSIIHALIHITQSTATSIFACRKRIKYIAFKHYFLSKRMKTS